MDILGEIYRCIFGLHFHLILLGRQKEGCLWWTAHIINSREQEIRESHFVHLMWQPLQYSLQYTDRQMLQNPTEYDSRHDAAQLNISCFRDAMQHNTECFRSEGWRQLNSRIVWHMAQAPRTAESTANVTTMRLRPHVTQNYTSF
jgi:hypothetical protein